MRAISAANTSKLTIFDLTASWFSMVLLLNGSSKFLQMQWYEEDVRAAIAERLSCKYEPKTVFYGSSSIRLWTKLYEDFAGFQPVNLGFGGSTLAACIWFFDRIVSPIRHPNTFILYAGDNDLGDGRHPEELLKFYREFLVRLRKHYPDIPFYYISIKPSICRMELIREIILANKLIEHEIGMVSGNNYFVNVFDKMIGKNGKPIVSYFQEDGLHLSRDGYIVWREIILNECLLD